MTTFADEAEAELCRTLYTLGEICQRCGVHAEIVIEMVEYGIVTPEASGDSHDWRFAAAALARLDRAQRLRRDLELNLPGLALSLDLLDEIAALRQQVGSLRQQVRQLHRDEQR